jgi:HTH-type transcriptional regulator/antitoxin HigA
MEDLGFKRKDLEDVIGSKGVISEILHRKRPLTVPMVRRLSEKLGLPTGVLAQADPLDLGERSFSVDEKAPLGSISRPV